MTASPTPVAPVVATRSGGDSCPGALRLHDAADGRLARIRVPGGLLTARQCRALADAAQDLADGRLHVTARGNVELRGVTDPEALAATLDEVGLLPSATHERARNIVSTPLAGLDGVGACGEAGLVPVVRELDDRLVAEPALAQLSGRFLIGLDDGRGDLLALDPDLAVALERADGLTTPRGRLVVAGHPVGVRVDLGNAPRVLVAAALAFVELGRRTGDPAWRIAEAIDIDAVRAALVRAALDAGADNAEPTAAPDAVTAPPGGPAPGVYEAGGRHAVTATLPLGVADAPAWRRLAQAADLGDGLVRTTPWRGVVMAGLGPSDARAVLSSLSAVGLATDAHDPWLHVGACTGRPGCARALADVRADATRLVASEGAGAGAVYLSGCERRCGHPRTAHTDVVAREGGRYAVARDDARDHPTVVAAGDLANVLSAARDPSAPAATPDPEHWAEQPSPLYSTPDGPTTKETA